MLNRRSLRSLALVAAAGLMLVVQGCENSDSVLGVDGGRVQFVLSSGDAGGAAPLAATDGDHGDRPRRFFQSASVTLSSILARNVDGVLVNVGIEELPVTVDVLALDGGREVTLPEGALPPATYDQVVIVMRQVEGVTLDGTIISITPPGGGWTAVVPLCPFVVVEGEATTVGLKFMLDRAFSWRDSRYHFQPHFVCDEG